MFQRTFYFVFASLELCRTDTGLNAVILGGGTRRSKGVQTGRLSVVSGSNCGLIRFGGRVSRLPVSGRANRRFAVMVDQRDAIVQSRELQVRPVRNVRAPSQECVAVVTSQRDRILGPKPVETIIHRFPAGAKITEFELIPCNKAGRAEVQVAVSALLRQCECLLRGAQVSFKI